MTNATFRIDFPQNEPVLAYKPNSPEKVQLKTALKDQAAKIVEIPLYINGERIFTNKTVDIVSPSNHGLVIAKCHQADSDHAKQAVEACKQGQKIWGSLGWQDRAAVFLKAAELIATKYRAKLNAATMLGQGKTVHQAEIDAACELIDFLRFNAHYLTKIYAEQPVSPDPGVWNRSVARGLEGFVYAITPFNFTAIAVNLATAPALMGCSVIWKPSPTSMLSSWISMEILEEAGLPPGVINMLPGDPVELSSVLLPHKELAGIHFTGSTKTFNMLWKEVGQNIDNYRTYPRIVGETGGKDFIFAHNSADLDNLNTSLIRGAFEFQGQKCSAASRAFIPRSIWPEIKKRLIDQTSQLKLGDVNDFTNFVSAVIDQRSFDKIKSFIDHAKSSDEAEIICGGECDDAKGYFIKPTIIEAKNPQYKTMVEEIFGPVLSIYVYEDEDLEATLDICDQSTNYALTGAIFAKERSLISHLTKRLENSAGNFYINDKPTGAVVGQQPFGGGRASGTNDKAGSLYNLLRWTSHRTIKENFTPTPSYKYPFLEES